MKLHRLAAFVDGTDGGNPAGVVLCDAFPADAGMLAIATDVGYSETAFVRRDADGWRVRYFAPAAEVSFCGHATIAAAALLGRLFGDRRVQFKLNDAVIDVVADIGEAGAWSASFLSPPAAAGPADDAVVDALRQAFSLSPEDLDPALPIRIASAGARHLVVGLATRERLAAMAYPFDPVRDTMTQAGLTTISLVVHETPQRYHARNPFAFGGVYEDPATGAAAAAFGGYLRSLGRTKPARIEILQGHDMGVPCRLEVDLGASLAPAVRVGGRTRDLADPVDL